MALSPALTKNNLSTTYSMCLCELANVRQHFNTLKLMTWWVYTPSWDKNLIWKEILSAVVWGRTPICIRFRKTTKDPGQKTGYRKTFHVHSNKLTFSSLQLPVYSFMCSIHRISALLGLKLHCFIQKNRHWSTNYHQQLSM